MSDEHSAHQKGETLSRSAADIRLKLKGGKSSGAGSPVGRLHKPDADGWLDLLASAENHPVGIREIWGRADTMAIELSLTGLGKFAAHPGLLSKLRGALGQRLMAGACHNASYAFRQNLSCHCRPCCASWLLFATLPVSRPNAPGEVLAKPFVLSARSNKSDLVISITLFGLASVVADQVRNAISSACIHDLPWPVLADDLGATLLVGQPSLGKITVDFCELKHSASFEFGASLTFSNGLETNTRHEVLRPGDVFDWTISRVRGLAPWFGVCLDERGIPLLREEWLDTVTSFSLEALPRPLLHQSSRSGEIWESLPQGCFVELDNDLSCDLRDLLVLGEKTHVGRGAVSGLGRYHLTAL